MNTLKVSFYRLPFLIICTPILLSCGDTNDASRFEDKLESLSEQNTELLLKNATLAAQLEAMREREKISKESLRSSYAEEFRKEIAEEIYAEANTQRNLAIGAVTTTAILFCLGFWFYIRSYKKYIDAQSATEIKSIADSHESKIDSIRREFEQEDYKRRIEHEKAMLEFNRTATEIETRTLVGKKLSELRAIVERELSSDQNQS
ncbi:hypothetical protein [Ectothiorhodospira haloalkaliphila]|uniref:hypothetical protein n=1 Tax=Ectothiorhodospira haloalkaliphila TaxID=421628 RepID=UPI00047DC3E6|nr:hypothetical protein [Ectothiorhodospira haloalkaliphila]